MAIETKSKLALADVSKPRRILAIEDKAVTRLLLGTVIGETAGFIKRKMADGEVSEGLDGYFEYTDAIAKDAATIASGILWLPGGIKEMVYAEVRKLAKGAKLGFAFDVFAIRDKDGGFSSEAVPLIPPMTVDPLGLLKAQVAEARAEGQDAKPTSKKGVK